MNNYGAVPSCMTRAYQQEEYCVFSAGSVYFERFLHKEKTNNVTLPANWEPNSGFIFFLIFLIKNPQFF